MASGLMREAPHTPRASGSLKWSGSGPTQLLPDDVEKRSGGPSEGSLPDKRRQPSAGRECAKSAEWTRGARDGQRCG